MSCPLSASDMDNLLSKADSLFTAVTTEQPCDDDCQERKLMEEISTNLDNAKDEYANAESKYKAAKKEYIVGRNGPSYYKNLETEENKKNLEKEVQENVDYFLVAMNATEKEINSLKNEIDNLNLIKQISSNNVNVSLRDIFGFDISPSALREGFENQPNKYPPQNPIQDLNTLNRKIYYETNKKERSNLLHKILYIVYYILALIAIVSLYYSNVNIYKKVIYGVIFIFYPFLMIFLKFFYNIFKIIFNFVV